MLRNPTGFGAAKPGGDQVARQRIGRPERLRFGGAFVVIGRRGTPIVPIAAEVAEIINEPVRKLETSRDLLRNMTVPDFETTGDALAALQYLVMQHITALNKAVLIIAQEVDRMGRPLQS